MSDQLDLFPKPKTKRRRGPPEHPGFRAIPKRRRVQDLLDEYPEEGMPTDMPWDSESGPKTPPPEGKQEDP